MATERFDEGDGAAGSDAIAAGEVGALGGHLQARAAGPSVALGTLHRIPRSIAVAGSHSAPPPPQVAAKLEPADAPTRYRLGRLLRRVPGRLQDAINQFNGCVMANESYPGLRAAQEEAQRRMYELKKTPRGWQNLVSTLVPVIVLLLTASHMLMS